MPTNLVNLNNIGFDASFGAPKKSCHYYNINQNNWFTGTKSPFTREISNTTTISSTTTLSTSNSGKSPLILEELDDQEEEEEEEEDYDIDYLLNSMVTVEKYNPNTNLSYYNRRTNENVREVEKTKDTKIDRWKPMYVMKFLCCFFCCFANELTSPRGFFF